MFPELTGYLFPNDVHIHWSLMIVLYPYITGLVAGAFIVSSLYHVFGREELRPIGRFALATSLCFLAVAGLPLLNHLGHPERALNIVVTPHFSSAMAGFGLLYASYFIIILLGVWFVFRVDSTETAARSRGLKRRIYSILALGVYDIAPEARALDQKVIRVLAAIDIPMACLLHGYVGFLFGSVKSNPWWSSVLIPVVFLFSAIVSGIALVFLLYCVTSMFRRQAPDQSCMDKLASFLLYALIIDVSLESLDFIHRLYESEESIEILAELVTGRLFISLAIVQLLLGTLGPMVLLAAGRFSRLPAELKRTIYFVAALLVQVGIFSTRWNVVIGGQLFSKSLRGLTVYKLQLGGQEGLLIALGLLILPFVILYVLLKLLPPWDDVRTSDTKPIGG